MVERFPALEIAQRQLLDLGDSMTEETAADCRKLKYCFADLDMSFFGHSIPFDHASPWWSAGVG